MKNDKQSAVKKYIESELPSDQGVTVPQESGKKKSFIPKEAIEASEIARAPEPSVKEDEFSQERVDKKQPVVDASEETLGG